jgi:2-polyprenyl-3-methyl-5-hydroxy-6-metoxy-1,4-benzoquinol methylase
MASETAARPTYDFLARWFPPSGDLLDLGCGGGGLLAVARERGLAAVGIDADQDNVAYARARGLDAHQGDVLAPDLLPGRAFDVVAIVHLIEHFDEGRAQALVDRSAARLRPGGRLLVVTPNLLDPRVARETFALDPTHVRGYSAADLSDLLGRAGLRTVHASTELLVDVGRRRALLRPLGRLRHGREHDRPNLVVVAEGHH